MKYRTLDEDGDYTLGRNAFLTQREAVGQAVFTRLRLLTGEWWENREDGLPLFESILGRYGGEEARQAIDLLISERILGTREVKKLVRFESTLENRQYRAFCVIDTSYGEARLTMEDSLRRLEVSV